MESYETRCYDIVSFAWGKYFVDITFVIFVNRDTNWRHLCSFREIVIFLVFNHIYKGYYDVVIDVVLFTVIVFLSSIFIPKVW